MALSSLRRGSLVELATRQLHEQVTAGTWPVGTRIPAETVLAEQLGVGRSTIREAIRALVHAGMLEARQGAGTYVRALVGQDWQSMVRRAAILEVYEVRQGLEFQAARLAAQRRTEQDALAIRAALDRRTAARAKGRDEAFVQADLEFHLAVVRAAHNDLLAQMFDSFLDVLREALLDYVHDEPVDERSNVAHAALADAIIAGDPLAAVAATSANLDVTAEQLKQ